MKQHIIAQMECVTQTIFADVPRLSNHRNKVHLVIKGDKAVKRAVKTGCTVEKNIEITDGLESGEKVVKDWTKVEE